MWRCALPTELRNEEVLLPQDARELSAQALIRRNFGHDWGSVALILTPDGSGGSSDLLTTNNMERLRDIESDLLELRAQDPDDKSRFYTFCGLIFQGFSLCTYSIQQNTSIASAT